MKRYYSLENKGFYIEGLHNEIPSNAIEISKEDHEYFLNTLNNGGSVEIVNGKGQAKEKPAPTQVEIIKEVIAQNMIALQNAIDLKAQSLGYDSAISCVAYSDSVSITAKDPVSIQLERFRREGVAMQKWVSQVWALAVVYQNEVLAGTKPLIGADDAVSLMPPLVINYD